VYWRQRAPFRSRTRDRQSSYNPQLCSACAPRTVVRRYLGSRPSTRARTRGGPIRRATPCMIIAGGSGARATADSASPHALWPAAARRTAPCSSPPADWDDPWRCVIAGSGKLGPAPVNTRLGDASARNRGIGRLLPCVGRGVCRDFMVRKCSEEVIRGGPALLSVGTDNPERAGARGRFCI